MPFELAIHNAPPSLPSSSDCGINAIPPLSSITIGEEYQPLASAMNLLFQSMLKAEMNNDPSSLARLSKEIRELSKLIPDFSPTPDPEWSDEQFEKSVS